MDDVLAVAFFRLWQGRHRLDRAKGQLPAILCRIALRAAADVCRHGWQKARRLEVPIESLCDIESAVKSADSESPAVATPKKIEDLRRIIDTLPDSYRQIVLADIGSRDQVASVEYLAAETRCGAGHCPRLSRSGLRDNPKRNARVGIRSAMNSHLSAILPDDDERMRRFLVDTLAPSDPVKASDAELEALREQLPYEPFSDERDESLLKKIETLMREASQSGSPLQSQAPLSAGDDSDVPPSPPSSPILGFLGNLTSLGGSFTPTLWTLLVLFSGMVFLGAVVMIVAIRGIRVEVNQPEVAQQKKGRADG